MYFGCSTEAKKNVVVLNVELKASFVVVVENQMAGSMAIQPSQHALLIAKNTVSHAYVCVLMMMGLGLCFTTVFA